MSASSASKDGPSFVPGIDIEEVGIIYGNVGTADFEVSVTAAIEKMEYVQVRHETCGWVLGQVDSLTRKTNLSIEKAKLISTGEKVAFEELVTARVLIIGYRDSRGLLQAPRTPFRAGESIYRASDILIKDVIGLKEDTKTGAYIGLLNGHEIPVFLDINTLVQKHVSVLAKTGGGKSYVTGDIIEELLKHKVTTLILDPHGEYCTLSKPGKKAQGSERFGVEPVGYGDQLLLFSPNPKFNPGSAPLYFTLKNLSPRELLELANLKNPKSYVAPLRKALDMLKSSKDNYTLRDIIKVLEADEEAQVGTLVGALEYLQETEIFRAQGTKITDLIEEGKTTVIGLKGSAPDIQQLVVERLSSALFELRKRGTIPPMMLVVEEAHNYCPQQGQVASSAIFRTIASEGRKFGLGLTIITQRPAKVDKNVLSQCNTQIILKVTTPHDLKAITSSSEGLSSGMEEEIQRLPIGVAIVTGGGLGMPLFVDVRPRETHHGGESIKVV
ncbi:MAG: ATP-binding protein [Candidatus Thermoplasmatota archaeon]|nr:ATP-binding protein [Candidatus Thermoplasmatota archaeon]